jgi:ABC-2 type transport system ATP-binding protein/lipopolysaccharide transport system ATP-binding protein
LPTGSEGAGLNGAAAQVRLENVGIDFPIFGASKNLRLSFLSGLTGGRIMPKRLADTVIIKALEDISLDVKSGDRIGLMGHNGAGKSTLLRVMAGVYEPTSGRVSIRGRLTPLLDVMLGFEMEDTGYDNIVSLGLLLGMSVGEITEKAPGIIEFSELGDFVHFPIRTYSSGMLARLGVSVATSVDPGILLLDEGIGAADDRFNEKLSHRFKSMVERTEILVLASHSVPLLSSMCDKAVLMHHGRVLEYGPLDAVHQAYQRTLAS